MSASFTPLQETVTQQQIMGQQQMSALPPGAQIVSIPANYNSPMQQNPQNQQDKKRKKAHMVVSVIFGCLALLGTVTVWVGSFINSYNSSFMAFYLILFEAFVAVPAVLTIVSSVRDKTNLGFTVTSIVIGGIDILATFIAGAVIGSSADYDCKYASYSYNYSYYDYYYASYYSDNYYNDYQAANCVTNSIAAAGLFVVCFSMIAIIVIASLETKRAYVPAPARTQYVIVQQPGMQPMMMQNVGQPMYMQQNLPAYAQSPPTYTQNSVQVAQPVIQTGTQ